MINLKDENSLKLTRVILLILLIICFCVTEFYISRTMYLTTDSDISSEMILAGILSSEKTLISPNWYYSSELRVLNTNVVFAPLFCLFKNWHTIRVVGTVISHVILLVCGWLLGRSLKLSGPLILFSELMLILPVSSDYYSYVLEYPYYVPHIAVTFFTLALMFISCESQYSGRRSILVYTSGIALSVFAGLGGARQLAILYLPLMLSLLLPLIRFVKQESAFQIEHKHQRYLIFGVSVLIGGLIGFVLNAKVLSGIYHFRTWSISFLDFDINRLSRVLSGLIKCFGYRSGGLYAVIVLRNAFSFFLLFLTLLCAVAGIKRPQHHDAYYFLSLFYLSGITVLVLLYSFTDMEYNDRYFLPVTVLTGFLISLGAMHLKDFRRVVRKGCISTCCICVLFSGLYYYFDGLRMEPENQFQEIAEFLVNNQYHYGYGNFWNANVLTELSNGQIEMHHWADSFKQADGDVNRTYKWLQHVKHDYEIPEGKVFMIFRDNEIEPNMSGDLEEESVLWKLDPSHIILKTEGHTVFGFSDYEEMIASIY